MSSQLSKSDGWLHPSIISNLLIGAQYDVEVLCSNVVGKERKMATSAG